MARRWSVDQAIIRNQLFLSLGRRQKEISSEFIYIHELDVYVVGSGCDTPTLIYDYIVIYCNNLHKKIFSFCSISSFGNYIFMLRERESEKATDV